MARPVVLERKIPVSVAPLLIWRELANTERLNRFLGNAALDIEELDDAGVYRFAMGTRIGGVPVRYRETPYRFVEGRYFAFRRELFGGPAADIDVRYDVEATDGGSMVTARYASTPRSVLFWPLVWIVTWQSIGRVSALVRALDRKLTEAAPVPLPSPAPNRAVLQLVTGDLLERHPPDLVRELTRHLATAPDIDLQRLRPFALADDWGVDRRELLRLCLDGAKSGLLDLTWGLLCPSCQTSSEELPSLDALTDGAHCHACDIRFGVDFDRAVEATFAPHPRIRPIDRRPFCIAGPALTPHVVEQQLLPAGESTTLEGPPSVGRYRVFARGGATASVTISEEGADGVDLQLHGATFDQAQLELKPRARIVVTGDDAPRHLKIERLRWSEQAATAWHVTLLPEFQALFGKQALRPGLSLSVSSVTLLFSDLVGSTALYSKVGDAAAFGVVTDALRFGVERVEAEEGVLVKTMGDAVMAAFPDPSAAYRSAAAMLHDWPQLQEAQPLVADIDLKVGLWTGPCTVVNANGVLDYFGQTVNTAARVQGVAGARELVVGAGFLEAQTDRVGLVEKERFERQVKGIDEPLTLVRLTPG